MEHWEYRAFDQDQQVHEGVEEAENFLLLAVKLRQNGLQVINAVRLDPSHKLAITRLNIMKGMLNTSTMQHDQRDVKIRRSWFETIISSIKFYFGGHSLK